MWGPEKRKGIIVINRRNVLMTLGFPALIGRSSAAGPDLPKTGFGNWPEVDGSENAPIITEGPKYPSLLRGYRVRPPWKVAGVDYPVGCPTNIKLQDWQTLNISGVTIDGNKITVRNVDTIFDGIDFSTNGGCWIDVTAGSQDAAGLIVNRCKFSIQKKLAGLHGAIINGNTNDAVVTSCEIDGGGALNEAVIATAATFKYNYVYNIPSQVLTLGGQVKIGRAHV
jgi:hypothetical protein